jgi:DNA polymerase elongation subunit (family B)
MGQQPSYGLKYIARTFCDFVYEEQGAHISELIDDERFKDIVEYLTCDIIALRKIDMRFGLFKYHESLRKLIGVKMDDIIKRTALIETLLMRKGIKPIPTKKSFMREEIIGAYVHQPTPGLKEWVACFDLKALYPSIILAYNISPDIDKMIPKTITFVLEEREKLRAMRMAGTADDTVETSEQSLKYVANAFYGYLGSIYAKLYYPDGARLITKTGRDIAEELRAYLMGMGYHIEYGDSVDGETLVEVDGINVSIKSLFTKIDFLNGSKEYCNVTGITPTVDDSLCSVLRPIKYVMRHKTNKQMYRLWFGNSNYVDVTEDHSLIALNNGVLEDIKPTDQLKSLIWKTKTADITLVKPTKVEKIPTPEYVYDIGMEDIHRFFANNVLVHNTDSTFISPVRTVTEGESIQLKINQYLKEWAEKHNVKPSFAPTIKFEKLYDKLLFKKKDNSEEAAKKNYAGHLVWKDGHEKDELSYTGLGIKRSDNAPLSKWLMENFFKLVLIDGNVDAAVKMVAKSIRDVTSGNIDVHQIAIPKAIKSDKENAWHRGKDAGEKYLNIRFQKSSKPKLLYTRSPTKEICIDDDTDSDYVKSNITIDWVLMTDKTITHKMRSLIESLGVSWGAVILGQRTWDNFR